jgi:sulfoxide reductase heme-binding subunit YedZ
MAALSAQAVNARLRFSPLWVYGFGAVPGLWLFARALTGNLGADPVITLQRGLGLTALQLLVAVLAVTPLRNLTGISLVRFRRALGVLAFAYAALHVAVWLALDLAFRWGEIWADIVKRPYITAGFAAFLMLVPLAVTSNNLSVRRLGAAAWKRLHWLTYPAAVLAAIHFLWLVKAWPREPLLYLGAVAALLALRWRPLRLRAAA